MAMGMANNNSNRDYCCTVRRARIEKQSQAIVIMDTPKREVSWLERSPPEIWAYFVRYLPGDQLGRLIMTGATWVIRRLRFPGVLKSIKLGTDFLVFKSMPRFLNDFPSLEELTIYSFNSAWSLKLGVTIDSIPSGVRKLELSGTWGKCNLFEKDGQPLLLSEHLPHLETLDISKPVLSDSSWMIHSPSSLTSLKLELWDGTVELPLSLIHFEAGIVKLAVTSFVTRYPPLLESFSVLHHFSGIDLVVHLLPPSTRTLSVGCSTNYEVLGSVQTFLEQIPKSLTKLVISEKCLRTNPQFISLLPASLATLVVIEGLACSGWHYLPAALTTLSFDAQKPLCTVASKITDKNGVHHTVTTIPFDTLPRSITKLELSAQPWREQCQYFCGPPETFSQSYFPPKLISLQISMIQLSPETAKLLPCSLTYLEIGNLSELVCKHLPAGIQTLIAHGALVSSNLVEFLPKSLTFLQISIYNPECNDWFDEDTGEAIYLDAKLMDFDDEDWPSNCFKTPLPPTLTHLALLDLDELEDSFMQHQSLPNLIELRLPRTERFSDSSIPLLCASLTTLILQSSSKVSGKSFHFLPNSLTELSLKSSDSIFDLDIQHLPRSLKVAHLNQAVHLTDLCIPNLPPHLTKLDMSKNDLITTSSFSQFPYPLRYPHSWKTAEFAKWYLSQGVVHKRP